MNERHNIHATCVDFNGQGILLLGPSGAGKSDLALRLISNHSALLVADDRVDITVHNADLIACAPEALKGLLEVRGVGICHLPYKTQTTLKLAVSLVDRPEQVVRMPEPAFWKFGAVSLPKIELWPFAASAADKIVIKLNAILDSF